MPMTPFIGRADLVAHRGQKLALGATGVFGGLARFPGGVYGLRHLGFGLFEHGDIGVHGDGADLLDLPLTDLQPATVVELLHVGAGRVAISRQALRDPCLDSPTRVSRPPALGHQTYHLLETHPDQGVRGGDIGEVAVPAVAEDQAVVRIVEGEGLGDALDRFEQT